MLVFTLNLLFLGASNVDINLATTTAGNKENIYNKFEKDVGEAKQQLQFEFQPEGQRLLEGNLKHNLEYRLTVLVMKKWAEW